MSSEKFKKKLSQIQKVCEIATDSFIKNRPNNLDENSFKMIIKFYQDSSNELNNIEKKYQNLQSLKYLENDIFIYFNESSGKTVNYFWERIKEENLPFKRENKLVKILKRGKIKNDIEYDLVIDTIVPYQQEGVIVSEEVSQLNKMIGDFENRFTKKN